MKRIFFIASLLIIFLGNTFAQVATAAKVKGVVAIPVKEFKKKVDSGNYILIDIRTPREYDAGHIRGAINIDFYKKDFYDRMSAYKNKPFLYYCRSGNRTTQARKRFNRMHFKEGYELAHGLNAWKRAGYELVK